MATWDRYVHARVSRDPLFAKKRNSLFKFESGLLEKSVARVSAYRCKMHYCVRTLIYEAVTNSIPIQVADCYSETAFFLALVADSIVRSLRRTKLPRTYL